MKKRQKNLPTFIVIGLIIMIIIIAIIYYVFLRYAPEMIITYSGYAVEGKTMVENLKNSDVSNVNQYLGLVEVHENDLLYKRLNSYYIGEDDKKEIDINYPIYINEGNALLNIGKNTKLITVNYEGVEGYPDFMMTDGVMYNGADITRADGNKYIFLKSEDEIYTNVGKIKISTALNEYEIKEFSNIYFTEDYIAYYEMQDGSDASDGSNENSDNAQNKANNVQNWYMQYKRINDIDMDSKIEVNNETMTYKEFLERLGIIQTEENNNTEEIVNETNEIEEPTENNVEEETTTQEQNNEGNTTTNESEPEEQEWQEGQWEKPTVSCTDFEGEVYTIRTNLSVTDRAGVISRGVIFEIYLDGRLNRRALATQTGNIEITNLQPDTEFEIRGVFYYYDEEGVEQEEEFYNGTVKTKPISALGTIDFSFQNGEIYSNKIELIHLKLNNDLNEEVIRGISRIQVEIGNVAYRLTNDPIDQLKAGEEITYQTSESLTSNSKIKYKITAFDRFGNELKTINNEGETITSKQSPRVSITATKQDVTEVILNVTLNNKDNVSLENYRYEITNQSGEIVKQGILGNNGTANDGSKETLTFNDLDPNGYYQIIIYGDYDLDNGEGIKQNSELGRASFVTRPLASLGYMQVHIDDKEVTQNSMNLGISIDENQTDARLLAILDKVEVVIYDRGKNVYDDGNNEGDSDNEENTDNGNESENDNQSGTPDNNPITETEVQRITFTEEEVQQLKIAEEVELNLDQLNSNTIYRIDVITIVKQGTVETVVEDKQNLEQIITLKMPAEVQVRNQFVIGTMIDLDIRIEDIDNAVLTNQVRIEVRDKDNKLIDLSEMPTNAEYERKTYEDLTPNETYRIIVYAPQYNIGSTDATYEADYILKEIEIVTETGISGNLDLIGLEKTPTGKNLIDVSSKVNWYQKCFDSGERYVLSYEESTNILTMKNINSAIRYIYYDLSKYLNQEITISFKVKSESNNNLRIMEKNNTDMMNTSYTVYYTINNLTNDWQEYSYTTTLSKSGYIGFSTTNSTTVEIQDLQVELGNRKTDYEQFQYDYNANVAVTVNDARNEITTNDYYIRIYKNDEQIQEIRYEELGEDNKIENVQKTYNIEPDADYRIELLVKISDRYYELDSQEFSTEEGKEILGIRNKNDLLKIQPYGEYIVLDNIDLTGVSGTQYKFGNVNIEFNGRINFNGKTLTRDVANIATSWQNSSLFYIIGEEGIIENIVLDLKMNNTVERTFSGGIAVSNYGVIRNIQINVLESTDRKNTDVYICCSNNYGVIENFVLNLEVPLYVNMLSGLVTGPNYGVVRNGYIYGENIKILNESSSLTSSVGVVSTSNRENAIIENIYSLVNIDNVYNGNNIKGNIAYENINTATVQNIYSVEIGENSNLTAGPNVYLKTSKKVYNNYYFTDEIFTSELETKGNKLSLWDAQFQNQIINGDGAFIVDELVNDGYYPQLDMPDVMPAQEYIELPEVEDADLPDILSIKVLEQGTDTVKVQFSVNNPSAEQIDSIVIQNLDVEILSQEYSNGKSTVIAELKNPVICVSSYEVQSITTKGAFGSSYTRAYDPGERIINVDLYKEIWNVNDWKAIKDSPTENYMLMEDLDFINEGNTIALGTINGILNGNGHSISNINLINNTHVISTLNGTLENLFINNFNQEVDYGGGFIADAQTGSVVDNVHMTNAHISKTESWGVGGLFHLAAYSTIRNSSVNNIEINTNGNVSNLNIGGIAGQINYTSMENCYVTGLQVNDSKGVNSGVGGIAGYGSGTNSIKNCYAEGTINSVNVNVGGIVGRFADGEIKNCYSKVKISTTNNNVGGIIGLFSDADTSNISNNLSISNIYTTSGLDSLNRIIGNNTDTTDNNYAYEKQLLNGYESDEKKGATLLSTEEILNLDLGDSYNYDGKTEGILPKLFNIEGTELLPNQEDILIDDNAGEEAIELEVESIEATKPNTTEAEITVRITNPEEIEIAGIEIEDMQVASITRNVTQNGVTSITVRATPTRFYDSYKLTGIRYKADNSEEEQTKEVENEIEVQFYKEIYTYEDWQSIEADTYQNYRLMADIDFTGKTNIKNNINVNRLEAENNVYTLKNIELEFNEQNTGLINNVKTSIKNIGFENITLTNTAGSGSYFGVIASNNGDIKNLKFKDITINATGISYVGTIGGMTSGNINDIELNNIIIDAGGYIGGFIGYVYINVDGEINNITADNINIEGSGDYVGGVFGYEDIEYMNISNISVSNSEIDGRSYTGGAFGYLMYGDLTYVKIDNSEIYGTTFVGGTAGVMYDSATAFSRRQFLEVSSSNVTGNGYSLGGIAGAYSRGNSSNWTVHNCNITQLSANSMYVGGLLGTVNFSWIGNYQVDGTIIESKGTHVGGLIGINQNNCDAGLSIGHIRASSVHGRDYVGGAYGYLAYGGIGTSYINVDIKADESYAGGVVGYLDNADMTASRNVVYITNTIVLDTNVEAQTMAGGLIGNITKELYRDQSFYYNNYIDADVTCEKTSTGSLIIGGRPDENDYITNTYVYKYSTLNGNYVYATNDNIDDDQYLVRTDLDKQNTYSSKIGLGTTYWNYAPLSQGKYPMIKDSYLYMPELQTGINLPRDPEISSINALSVGDELDNNDNEAGASANDIADENGISTQSIESLPSYKVYPTKVDEINIDFGDIPEGISFTYYVNGEEKETVDLEQKTYTFKYNYQDTLEIKVTNGVDEETITITPEDVRSEASLVGSNNAYLLGTSLYINGEVQSGNYVNVYEGYALNSSGQIVNIGTKEASSEVVTTSLQQTTTTPLHTYNYNGNTIETYGTYSTVNGNIKQQIYNVRSGGLSALSSSLDMKIDNYIVDNYNNKEYQTILSSNGELVDLKEMLQYPENFLNRNIKQIWQNSGQEKTEMMILYNTGKVIVFNYVTGDVIYENEEKADTGLADYITGSVSNIWNDYEEKQADYEKSKELAAKLAELPVSEAMQQASNNSGINDISADNTNNASGNSSTENFSPSTNANTNTDSSYITVYNADTGEYEVYSEEEILNGEDENPVSETTKIKENGLESVYNYETNEESKPQANGAIIVVAIIGIAIIALIVLRRVIVKNNNKK